MVKSQSKFNHHVSFWMDGAKMPKVTWSSKTILGGPDIAPNPSVKGGTAILGRAQEACSFLHALWGVEGAP